jgi:hypothetical protein
MRRNERLCGERYGDCVSVVILGDIEKRLLIQRQAGPSKLIGARESHCHSQGGGHFERLPGVRRSAIGFLQRLLVEIHPKETRPFATDDGEVHHASVSAYLSDSMLLAVGSVYVG